MIPFLLVNHAHPGVVLAITAVGDIAQSNLETLGHLTVVFSGAKEAGLPGSICVEAKPLPNLNLGSKIAVVE